MKKTFISFFATSIIFAFALAFTACGGSDNDQLNEEEKEKLEKEEKDRYEEFVTPEIENILVDKLGLKIHRGINPPKMEGYYILEGTCSKSTIIADGYVGRYIADYIFNLYNQRNLMVDFVGYELKPKTSIIGAAHAGEGTFITGEGDNFSIFFDEKITSNDDKYVVTVMTVLSGQLDRNDDKQIVGIKNGQYVFMMIDNDGKPQTMQNNTARLYEDEYISVYTKEAFDLIHQSQNSKANAAVPTMGMMALVK